MDYLMNVIKDNMLAIKYIQAELQFNTQNVEQVFEYMMGILIDQIHTSSDLNHKLDEFKLGVIC